MHSIKEIFIVGHGPSSSHTMGPGFACEYILKKYPQATKIVCTLYGSLALTGKGHLTDYVINLQLSHIPHDVVFNQKKRTKHPNTMVFEITDVDGNVHRETVLSIGGGSIYTVDSNKEERYVYPQKTLQDIIQYCSTNNLSFYEYVLKFENDDISDFMSNIYDVMMDSKDRGLNTNGVLPGSLHVARKASKMHDLIKNNGELSNNYSLQVAATSFAVAEENASGGIVSTAPTCGSAGVLPGAITYLQIKGYKKEEIIKGMLVAGLIGIIAKTNGSVSGAEAGCQAEIGVACAMSAAMISTVTGKSNIEIERSAEIALEHSLGLTCDPVCGYVQIPCIERCAIYALKAIDASQLASVIPASESKVNFDDAVKTMVLTGKDLKAGYRETGISGLAKIVK